MSRSTAGRLGAPALRLSLIAGVAIGLVYALSPLTIWFVLLIVPLVWWARRGLGNDEARSLTRILVIAIALRVMVVGGLFLLTSYAPVPHVPFGRFFGDEEYFLDRSLWLRNLAFDIPLHTEDLISAFDDYSASSYLYLLGLIQTLTGPAPYGLHLVGILFYVGAVVVLFRLVLAAYGRMPAFIGLAVLLFLPSLFAWSVSVLKEPLFMLISAAILAVAAALARTGSWRRRALALGLIVALVAILESVRQGGAVLSGLGVVLGLAIGYVSARPRALVAALVAAPVVAGAILSRPAVHFKAYTTLQSAARQHWGHIWTEGYSYYLLDERFYDDKAEVLDLQLPETMRFLVRAGVGYVAVPLPWKVQSRSALAYLPEQVVWYVIAALAPFGCVLAFRRDPILTGLLAGHAMVAAVTVALTSGNIGTLVRHRGLALPYMVWLSAVGACEIVAGWTRQSG
jgi:hypothetical protein